MKSVRLTPVAALAIMVCMPGMVRADDLAHQETSTPAMNASLPCLPLTTLHDQRRLLHSDLAQQLAEQRAQVAAFETYAHWLKTNLGNYDRYIQAGSTAAAVSRFLPIPYAGQAAVFSKVLAQFSASLTSTSQALSSYHTEAKKLQAKLELCTSRNLNIQECNKGIQFAETTFLPAMEHTRNELTRVSELTGSTLAFLQGLHTYLTTGDAYMSKVKGVFKKEDKDKEASFISAQVKSLSQQAHQFSGRLTSFKQQGDAISMSVRTDVVYQNLLKSMQLPTKSPH